MELIPEIVRKMSDMGYGGPFKSFEEMEQKMEQFLANLGLTPQATMTEIIFRK